MTITTPAIRNTNNGWEAYLLTFTNGTLTCTECVGYFDTKEEAASAASS